MKIYFSAVCASIISQFVLQACFVPADPISSDSSGSTSNTAGHEDSGPSTGLPSSSASSTTAAPSNSESSPSEDGDDSPSISAEESADREDDDDDDELPSPVDTQNETNDNDDDDSGPESSTSSTSDDSSEDESSSSSTEDSGDDSDSTSSSTSSSTTESDSEGDSSDPTEWASNETCIPQAPSGWTGPIALAELSSSNNSSVCKGAYPKSEQRVHSDQLSSGGKANCQCACGDPEGLVWQNSSFVFDGPICKSGGTGFSVGGIFPDEVNQCSEFLLGQTVDDNTPLEIMTAYTDEGPGICPSSVKTTLPSIAWSQRAELCSSGPLDGCQSNQICAPNPFSQARSAHCIYRSGNFNCPSGHYSVSRHNYFKEHSDDRSCNDNKCVCGDSQKYEFRVELFSNTNCTGSANILKNDECLGKLGKYSRFRLTEANPEPCQASGSQSASSGTITAEGPITVCCDN